MLRIALASAPLPASITEGLLSAEKFIMEAAEHQAEIICFPESFIPGYPVEEGSQKECSPQELRDALDKICSWAKQYHIAVIMPMDWHSADGLLNVAQVISGTGEWLGYQSKNQLDPSEDHLWVAGTTRTLFNIKGIPFGITICHEGFRYPESVRWAAQQGAKLVFHPHCTGSNKAGTVPTTWGSKENPYYEKAIMMRAMENTIYMASCNYSFEYPESASAVIAPGGACMAHQAYAEPGILVTDIDPDLATGLLAKRFKSEWYAQPASSSQAIRS